MSHLTLASRRQVKHPDRVRVALFFVEEDDETDGEEDDIWAVIVMIS